MKIVLLVASLLIYLTSHAQTKSSLEATQADEVQVSLIVCYLAELFNDIEDISESDSLNYSEQCSEIAESKGYTFKRLELKVTNTCDDGESSLLTLVCNFTR